MTVPVRYDNKQWAVLAATGPGLTPAVAELVWAHRRHVVLFGCNDAYRVFHDLNVHYAADGNWWHKHHEHCRTLPSEKWAHADDAINKGLGLNLVAVEHYDNGLSRNPAYVNGGGNSGMQLMGLAYLMGIRRMVLVGYNLQSGPRGEKHFFGNHPPGLVNCSDYSKFVQSFQHIPEFNKDLTVIQCTPDTALRYFPERDLAETLRRVATGSAVV